VAVESAAASVVALTSADVRDVCCWWVWMVVRFVCVVRVPLCARVSRVCPVCVPCVSRLPPVSYRYGLKPPEGAGRTRVNAMGVCVHVKVCLCEF